MKNLAKRTEEINMSSVRGVFEMASRMTGLVRLEIGQPDFDTPPHILEAGRKALDEGFIGYTSATGIQETREAAAYRYLTDYGVTYNPDTEIVIVSGAAAAIHLTLRVIVDPGDEVLRPDPSWPQYDSAIRDADGIPVLYPLLPDKGFSIDFEKLEQLTSAKTKAIILCSPSSPTGALLDEEQLKKVYQFALKHDLYIISDEAYDKICYDRKHISMQSIAPDISRIITTCSASKDYAMCGWRIGFAAGPAPIMAEITKFQSLTTTCPNYIAQKAYAEALRGSQQCCYDMRDEYKKRRDYFVAALNEIPGVRCYLPAGAFYAFVDIRGITEDDREFSLKLLQDAKVTCSPGSNFGNVGKGFIRFCYAASMDDLKEAIRRIKAALL